MIPYKTHNWKVVLIDDEEGIRRVTGISLADAGYKVHTAENGEEGIRICNQVHPQIVITDIRMPKMDGIAVLEKLKSGDRDIEVIVATAFGEMDLAVRALQLDASDFITKPVDDEALSIALERAKERYSTRKKIKDYTAFLEEKWAGADQEMERKVADQAKILHQDKMMSLGRLAASVVHEINNPLAGILNYSRLMARILERGPLTAEHRDKFSRYLELMENETGRCSQIVSSLLAFSRKSPPCFSDVNIGDLLDKCAVLSRHKLELNNIRLELSTDRDIPMINGDANQLQQCIINLVFNAIDAMPGGGTLVLKGKFDSLKNIVSILVKDTGTGITEKDLPHIFEPFYTTKDEGYGVGLGLSTLYGIVEHHKGTVDVKTSMDRGTTFILGFRQGISIMPST